MPAPVDLDALATQFGGTSTPPPAPTPGTAHPDYDALAAQFGGTSTPGGARGAKGSAGTAGTPPDMADMATEALRNYLGGMYGIQGPAATVAAGAVKSGVSPLGHLLNFVTKPRGAQPLDPNTVRAHVNDAAQWIIKGSETKGVLENLGAIGEQTAEMMSGEGLLRLAGKAPAIAGAAETLKNLEAAQSIAKFLGEHKVMAGLTAVGLKAVQEASMMGAQTYAHTGDVGQAGTAAAIGGVLGGGASSIAEGARYLRGVRDTAVTEAAEQTAKEAAEEEAQKPTTMDVGGTPVTVLKEQVTPEGGLTGVTATGQGRPEVAEAQQQELENILQNKAQTSLAGVLDRANQTRPMQFKRPALEPHYFKIGEGPTATWAEKLPPAEYAKKSGITKDPLEAEAWLADIDKHMRDPNLPEATFTQLNDLRQSLEDQLGLYHSSGQVQPVDVQSAVRNTRSFGDAGAQAHGAARDLFQMVDSQTDGQFNRLRELEKKALATMSDHQASNEAVNNAQEDLQNVRGQINSLFDTVQANPNDIKAARELYRDGLVYKQLHAQVERMANGITLGDTESGLKRVVTGNNSLFENFLSKGNNRSLVSDLIGDQGVTDLKTMFELTRDANLARKTAEVVENSANEGGKQGFKNLLARYGKPGEALILANAFAHPLGAATAALGMGYGKGAMVGSGLGLTTFLGRQLLDNAAANGTTMKLIDFAVRNNVDPRIYAPLIARAIMVPQQEQPQPKGNE